MKELKFLPQSQQVDLVCGFQITNRLMKINELEKPHLNCYEVRVTTKALTLVNVFKF